MASLIALAGAVPLTAQGANFGTSDSVAVIQHDVPLLLATFLRTDQQPILDTIYTNGSEAVVNWHASATQGLMVLRLKGGKWWWTGGAATLDRNRSYWTGLRPPGLEVTECAADRVSSPTIEELLAKNLISKSFARRLRDHFDVQYTAAAPVRRIVLCDYFSPMDMSDGYVATLHTNEVLDTRLRGSAPPAGRIPPTYYVFTLATQSGEPQVIDAGSTFQVWFPFVLDPAQHYELLLKSGNTVFQPAEGSLHNNTLTFKLPRVQFSASIPVHGKVDAATIVPAQPTLKP